MIPTIGGSPQPIELSENTVRKIVASTVMNLLERLKDRCSFKGVNGPCLVARVAHDAVHHDFTETE